MFQFTSRPHCYQTTTVLEDYLQQTGVRPLTSNHGTMTLAAPAPPHAVQSDIQLWYARPSTLCQILLCIAVSCAKGRRFRLKSNYLTCTHKLKPNAPTSRLGNNVNVWFSCSLPCCSFHTIGHNAMNVETTLSCVLMQFTHWPTCGLTAPVSTWQRHVIAFTCLRVTHLRAPLIIVAQLMLTCDRQPVTCNTCYALLSCCSLIVLIDRHRSA